MTDTKKPIISVVIPVYNAEKYIEQAVQSILSQTYSDFECIIIDDCSKDNTREIIQKIAKSDQRIIAVQNSTNLKICKTLNKGISLAQGKYIARMDADDISMPDRFEKQINVLEENKEIGIVGGSMELFNHKGPIGIRTYHQNDKEIRRNIFRYSPFCHPTVLIRKSVLDQVGYYNESGVYAEDYDLYFRIGQISKFANIKDIVLQYRIIGTSMTGSRADYMEFCTQYFKLKAVFEYGYKMTWWDIIYSLMQLGSMLFLRGKLRVKIFNFFRNK